MSNEAKISVTTCVANESNILNSINVQIEVQSSPISEQTNVIEFGLNQEKVGQDKISGKERISKKMHNQQFEIAPFLFISLKDKLFQVGFDYTKITLAWLVKGAIDIGIAYLFAMYFA
ncbi:MAG: hypothetical protein IPG01_13315 [Chitinophagaceae bacterium]|nr:hypothetical protein [Chitinophagaceae bacterium]